MTVTDFSQPTQTVSTQWTKTASDVSTKSREEVDTQTVTLSKSQRVSETKFSARATDFSMPSKSKANRTTTTTVSVTSARTWTKYPKDTITVTDSGSNARTNTSSRSEDGSQTITLYITTSRSQNPSHVTTTLTVTNTTLESTTPSATHNHSTVTETATEERTFTVSETFFVVRPSVVFSVVPIESNNNNTFDVTGDSVRSGAFGFRIDLQPNSTNAWVPSLGAHHFVFLVEHTVAQEARGFEQEVVVEELSCFFLDLFLQSAQCMFPAAPLFSISGSQSVKVLVKEEAFGKRIRPFKGGTSSLHLGVMVIQDNGNFALAVSFAALQGATAIVTGFGMILTAGPFEGLSMMAVLHSPCATSTDRESLWVPWHFISPFTSLGVASEIGGNLGLIALVFSLHGCVVLFFVLRRNMTVLDAFGWLRFPRVGIGVVKWLYVSTAAGTFSLLGPTSSGKQRGLAVFVLLLVLAVPVVAEWISLKVAKVHFVDYILFQQERFPFLFPSGVWVPPLPRQAFGLLFEYCRAERLWMAAYPLAFQLVLCAILYIPGNCSSRYFISFAWCVAVSVVVGVLQPYRVPVFNINHVVCINIVGVISLLLGVSVNMGHVAVLSLKLLFQLLLMALVVARTVYDGYLWYKEWSVWNKGGEEKGKLDDFFQISIPTKSQEGDGGGHMRSPSRHKSKRTKTVCDKNEEGIEMKKKRSSRREDSSKKSVLTAPEKKNMTLEGVMVPTKKRSKSSKRNTQNQLLHLDDLVELQSLEEGPSIPLRETNESHNTTVFHRKQRKRGASPPPNVDLLEEEMEEPSSGHSSSSERDTMVSVSTARSALMRRTLEQDELRRNEMWRSPTSFHQRENHEASQRRLERRMMDDLHGTQLARREFLL